MRRGGLVARKRSGTAPWATTSDHIPYQVDPGCLGAIGLPCKLLPIKWKESSALLAPRALATLRRVVTFVVPASPTLRRTGNFAGDPRPRATPTGPPPLQGARGGSPLPSRGHVRFQAAPGRAAQATHSPQPALDFPLCSSEQRRRGGEFLATRRAKGTCPQSQQLLQPDPGGPRAGPPERAGGGAAASKRACKAHGAAGRGRQARRGEGGRLGEQKEAPASLQRRGWARQWGRRGEAEQHRPGRRRIPAGGGGGRGGSGSLPWRSGLRSPGPSAVHPQAAASLSCRASVAATSTCLCVTQPRLLSTQTPGEGAGARSAASQRQQAAARRKTRSGARSRGGRAPGKGRARSGSEPASSPARGQERQRDRPGAPAARHPAQSPAKPARAAPARFPPPTRRAGTGRSWLGDGWRLGNRVVSEKMHLQARHYGGEAAPRVI